MHMRKFSVALLVVMVSWLMSASVVSAASITAGFSTTGLFTASGTNVYTDNGVTITFMGVTNASVITPSNTSLGEFIVSGSPTTTGSFLSDFILTVNQTVPAVGSDTASGTIGGTITIGALSDSSSVAVEFTSLEMAVISAGGYMVTYNPVNETLVVPPSTNSGIATLQGQITAVPVPLPAAAWGGMSLLGLLGAGKLRKKMRAA
jgi:hypothetical protein